MKEISNRFCILEPATAAAALLMGALVAPEPTDRQFSATGKILFDQTPNETDSGLTWNQSFRAVTTDPEVLQYKGAKAYPAFYMTDGSLRVIGTHDSAPTIMVSPYDGGRYLIQASYQAPQPLTL